MKQAPKPLPSSYSHNIVFELNASQYDLRVSSVFHASAFHEIFPSYFCVHVPSVHFYSMSGTL
jgi:hypothetical protein